MSSTPADLPLLPSLQGTLTAQGITRLTSIQRLALPHLLARESVVAIAETGSGKTLTYVLPILDQLKRLEEAGNRVEVPGEPRALVVVPTRELGEQVARVFKTFTHDTRLRVRTVLGGQKASRNRENVAAPFEVLVATPGRLEQVRARNELSLDAMRVVVLDEADQLLDLGFLPQVLEVVRACPSRRQLMLFSATMSEALRELVAHLFSDAILLETAGSEKLPPGLVTRHVDVPDGRRFDVLPALLAEPTRGGTMLFANTREQCDRTVAAVKEAGRSCEALRGNMDPVRRRANLQAFRDGELDVLVATDMAARGLDIPHVARVINVHLPQTMEAYLHRVGRTARAGRQGLVINLVTPRDSAFLALLDDGAKAPEVVHPPGARRRFGPRDPR